MKTKEETTATIVRALNDALNARDREATAALFTSDGIFRPGAAGASFEGPEVIANALFGFLGAHKSGQFETVHEVAAGDEAYTEWKWGRCHQRGRASRVTRLRLLPYSRREGGSQEHIPEALTARHGDYYECELIAIFHGA
jgi:ketosteroid isomerase-like protein